MNHLIQIREKLKKEERLHKAQLTATKNGEVKPYRQSVFERRKQKAKEHINSLNN